MRTRLYIGAAFSILSAIIFVACGGGGNSGGGEPALGITSIDKMGATAIPNPKFSTNTGLTGAFLDKLPFWGKSIAYAVETQCSPTAPTSFPIQGGKIWLEEVYVILDEVQFNQSVFSETIMDEVTFGPFGLDLLNNDLEVEESFAVDVPEGEYQNVRFRVKRVEDDPQAADSKVPESLVLKISNRDKEQRPSVWIKGQIEVEVRGNVECESFTFLTDRRWESTINFKEFNGSHADDAVLALDVEKSFQLALDSLGSNALDLKAEIGKSNQSTQLGLGFLDGRVKNPSHGTPIAVAIAGQLPFQMKVFIQGAGTFDSTQEGTTLIDDSAILVSDSTIPPDIIDDPPVSGIE